MEETYMEEEERGKISNNEEGGGRNLEVREGKKEGARLVRTRMGGGGNGEVRERKEGRREESLAKRREWKREEYEVRERKNGRREN